jgi:PEP-CTERM motif
MLGREKMQMNRKILSALSAAALTFGAFATTNAAVLISDAFPYSDGNLAGDTPSVGGIWTLHSGATNDIQVVSNAAVVNESTGVQDDHSNFDGGFTDAAGDMLTSSYTVNVAAPSTGTLTPVYFGMFLAGSSNFTSRVWVAAPATVGDGYRIALSQNSSSTATGVVYSPDLVYGSTHTVVTTYDYTNKNGALTVDGTLLGTTSDMGFSDAVTAYAFRQSATAGNVVITIDNLEVDGVAVPEPASLSLLGMGAMGLMARRRK